MKMQDRVHISNDSDKARNDQNYDSNAREKKKAIASKLHAFSIQTKAGESAGMPTCGELYNGNRVAT